jgi:hypothetical protein
MEKHMKRLAVLAVSFLATGVCSAEGDWRFTEAVDSPWAGIIQVKWNSATGEAYHTVGTGAAQDTWSAALTHIAWTEIFCPDTYPVDRPNCGWAGSRESEDLVEGRYVVKPQVVFGDGSSHTTELAALFMVDTLSGAVYIAYDLWGEPPNPLGPPEFFHHDVVRGATWTQIEEASDLPSPSVTEVGRYEISAVNSARPMVMNPGAVLETTVAGGGRLGPFVTRLDRVTGRVDVAIPKNLLRASPGKPHNTHAYVWSTADVVHYVWCQISDTDPHANPSADRDEAPVSAAASACAYDE